MQKKVKAGKRPAAGSRPDARNRKAAGKRSKKKRARAAAKAAPPAKVEKLDARAGQAGQPEQDGEANGVPAELRGLFSELTNRRQRAFLAAYVRTAAIKKAARFIHASAKSHYRWLHGDPRYRECFQQARRVLADAAEEEVYRRAYAGYDTPILYQGEVKGYYKSYSDTLAMFMLKGLKPEVYRDSAGVPFEGPTSITITVKHPERDGVPGAVSEAITFPLPGSKTGAPTGGGLDSDRE